MNVLVISTHPDDETLGCGGTILKHVAAGDRVHWLIVTQAFEPVWSRAVLETKSAEVAKVAAAFGIDQTIRLALPTTRLDVTPLIDIMTPVREAIERTRPEVVYVVHGGDVSTDHHAVSLAAMSVLKPFYMSRLGVRRVLAYETLSSTDAAPALLHRLFAPTVFSDVSPFMDRKIEIMAMYASETQPDPMPRGPSAIRALGRSRGATIAVEYAEAFMLLREVF